MIENRNGIQAGRCYMIELPSGEKKLIHVEVVIDGFLKTILIERRDGSDNIYQKVDFWNDELTGPSISVKHIVSFKEIPCYLHVGFRKESIDTRTESQIKEDLRRMAVEERRATQVEVNRQPTNFTEQWRAFLENWPLMIASSVLLALVVLIVYLLSRRLIW
ncbi:hypothetical protein ACTJNK_13480 [Achromobacter anxifer]